VLVELVLLLGEEASVLVGEGEYCRVMQWYSSSWCFPSGMKHRRWLAMVTAAAGCSGARRAGASPGGSIRVGWRWWLLLGDAVALVELVLLPGEEASVLVGEGDCCCWLQAGASPRGENTGVGWRR